MKKTILFLILLIFSTKKKFANDTIITFHEKNDTLYLKLSQNTKTKEQTSFKDYAIPIVSVLSAIGAFIGVFFQVRSNNKAKEKELQDRRRYEIIKVYSDLITSINLDDKSIRDSLSLKGVPSILFFQKKIILLSLLKSKSNIDFSLFEKELNKYEVEALDTKEKARNWITSFSNEFYILSSQL